MEDTLYQQLYTIVISGPHWNRPSIVLKQSPSLQGSYAKARVVHVAATLYLDQHFREESEELERVLGLLSESRELRRFTFETRVTAFRRYGQEGQYEAVWERLKELYREAYGLGLDRKERELKFAIMVVRFWKLR